MMMTKSHAIINFTFPLTSNTKIPDDDMFTLVCLVCKWEFND